MGKPVIVIIFIILFVGIAIYFISHSSEIFKPLPRESFSSGRGARSSGYGAQGSSGSSGSSQNYGGSSQNYGGSYFTSPSSSAYFPSIPDYQIPSGFTRADLSPYFNKVKISSAYFSSYGSAPSQIQLYAYLTPGERVNVTGWLIRGNRGSVYIPQAVDVYDPSGLAPQSDIYLKNGDVLYIYSTTSGVGVNLHLNKCIGYLSNTNIFNPPLPLNCPYINRSDIANFTGQCQTYIMSLATCQMPAANPPIPQNDYGCLAFINKLNYGGCFSVHRSDYDFLSNEWRVWTGSQFLDFQHDRLLLFDRQGLLVSEYTY